MVIKIFFLLCIFYNRPALLGAHSLKNNLFISQLPNSCLKNAKSEATPTGRAN